jgi:predicted TPR repeat methyltransferase
METAPAAAPQSADDWYRLGNARQDEGRDDLAVECYERVVQLAPAHAKAWNNLGVSRQKLGRSVPAADAYRQALAIDPSLLQAVVNLAHLCRESGDFAGAEPLFARATALDAANPDSWEALGQIRLQLGRTDPALEAFRGWLACDRSRLEPYLALARVEIARGNPAAAERWFQGALEHHPANPMLRHMFAAVRGDTTAMPAEGYVEQLFDGMAPIFEQQLRKLGYQIPEALARSVLPLLQSYRPARVLDLGCGTGLMGAALAPAGASIIGIDLSAEMLARAAAGGHYADLIKSDLTEYLRAAGAGTFNAVMATDVFVYLGDLAPVFEGVARALAPSGLFAFSAEVLETGDFALKPNGRYAHSATYLRAIAARQGLSERNFERVRLRVEYGTPVEGWLALFVR